MNEQDDLAPGKFRSNPILEANLISQAFYSWLSPFLSLGHKRPIVPNDLYDLTPNDDSTKLIDQLETKWNKEAKKGKHSLIKVIVKIWYLKIILNTCFVLFEETLRIVLPFLISNLLDYFTNQMEFKKAIYIGFIIIICFFASSITHHLYYFNILNYGVRIRTACIGLCYRKSLKLSSNILNGKLNGKIVNLFTNDAQHIEEMAYFLPYFIISPIQTIIVIYILIQKVDTSFLSGLFVLLSFIPFQILSGKIFSHFRVKAAKQTDSRISLLSEVIESIKIIKMYGWEQSFKQLINKIRKREMNCFASINSVYALNSSLENDFSCLITYISVTFLISMTNIPLKPQFIVFAIGLYSRLCSNLGYFLSRAIILLMSGLISFKRIQEFLLENEQKQIINNYNNNNNQNETDKMKDMIKVENLNARWPNNSDFKLKSISFNCKKNDLIGVIGSVGSGKSSFLMALLNEMDNVTVDSILNLNEKSIFYVSQEPWIFPGTIRQNIIFGRKFDSEKLKLALKLSCLDKDIKTMQYKENTIIGEKGISLSGGQRARVSLARALYSNADVYLFDDPLSAVDATVAKQLFDNCINGYLKNKLRVLVTHQIQHVIRANKIILLENGEMKAYGSYQEILSKYNLDIKKFLSENDTEIQSQRREQRISEVSNTSDNNNSLIKREQSFLNNSNSKDQNEYFNIGSSFGLEMNSSKLNIESSFKLNNKNDYEENYSRGSIKLITFYNYFKSSGSILNGLLILIFFVTAQFFMNASDYYVSKWADLENKITKIEITSLNFSEIATNLTSHTNSTINFVERTPKFQTYSLLVGLFIIMIFLRSLSFYITCIKSSFNLHKMITNSVMSTRTRFFDLNPVGRIMNRFSKDIGVLDQQLPITLFEFLTSSMWVLGILTSAIIINYLIAIFLIPLCILFLYARRYYLPTSNDLKRLDGIYRSPILVTMSNTLIGITTIRASRNELILQEEFEKHLNNNNRAHLMYIQVQRWFQFRLELIAGIYSASCVLTSILAKEKLELTSGQIGLLLTYCLNLTSIFQWSIRQSCEVENLMTSVERIWEYIGLPDENEKNKKTLKTNDKKKKLIYKVNETLNEKEEKLALISLPTDWPSKGEIIFDNVSYSYDENLPNVLKELSFKINPGEKIGIVGRTGAGKSSIIQTIFRMSEPTGNVLIDNVNTKDLNLSELRCKISIIPQEPILFLGTIRSNLDPFNQYSDNLLWEALEKVQLKETIKEMKMGLESHVEKNGSNLSVGQKQLICLARAIIKKSKILLIDEATANVDLKTDALVQKSIRECFSNCTVLTIAHRLKTIIDNDRIMCLSKGKLQNFGRPIDLLNDESSILRELVYSLDKSERDNLISLAQANSNKSEQEDADLIESKKLNSNDHSDCNNNTNTNDKVKLLFYL